MLKHAKNVKNFKVLGVPAFSSFLNEISVQNISNQIKSFIILSVIRRSDVTSVAGPISASLRPGNTDPFEKMSQRRRAVGNTVSNLTGPRFEPLDFQRRTRYRSSN